MKKFLLPAILLSTALVFNGCSPEMGDDTNPSRVLLIEGSPYYIKGVCYHPVPKGSNKRSFDRLTEDLALMKEMGVNSIRVYVPITERAVLDEIHAAGIKVIINIGYDQGGVYDIKSGSFIDYVDAYKDHPAILLWELGNEFNFHPQWFGGDIQNWYDALNAAALLTKEHDPSRPVATAHGELPDKQALTSCPDIDVWGMNVYRWDNPEGIFTDWKKISDKPMYLSEAGADSYMAEAMEGYEAGVNETAQADAMRNILDDISRFPGICSGVAVFAFVDEWWKDSEGSNDVQDVGGKPPPAGFPYDAVANEEYWGVLNLDRSPKEAFHVVKTFFTEESGD
jgi:exo-beta-1,3-glucanase (GH17 family)